MNYKNYLFALRILLLIILSISVCNAQNVGINTLTPNSSLEVNGSIAQTTTAITGSLTLNETHSIVLCTNGATPVNVTLPAASGCKGRIYVIKRESGSNANVTIIGTIDGVSNLVMRHATESATLVSNGVSWNRIGSYNVSFPMGEISYFGVSGITVPIAAQSNGTTNMVACRPVTTFFGGPEFTNGGSDVGRLQYVGTSARMFHIACSISASPTSNNDVFVFGVAKNGVVIASSKIIQKLGQPNDTQSTALHVMIDLSQNDYLELFVGNLAGARNVILSSLNLSAMGM